jgi:putative ABC transport system permease protein
MRPEPPAAYRPSVIERPWLRRHVTTAIRMVLRNLERQPLRALSSVIGIALAGAILQVGFSLMDAMEQLIETQFAVAERQDMTVSFVRPVPASARAALARLPGVLAVEPQRVVAARLRAGHRERTLALTAVTSGAALRRIVDRSGRVIAPPPDGVVMSAVLADVLGVRPGEPVTLEVLEGRQPVAAFAVAGLVDDSFGLSAYVDESVLNRLVGDAGLLSGAALRTDATRDAELSRALKDLPAVGGVASKRVVVRNFREMMAQNMNVTLVMNVLFAGIIAFGVVYNAARVSLSERSRELASLRVLGFTRAEISLILLGELAILTLLALPLAVVIGQGLTALIVQLIESEVYRFPIAPSARMMAWSALTVIAAALLSGLVVRRRLDRLDLVAVLKTRE